MKHRFLSMLVMFAMGVAAMADELPGVTVEYVAEGSVSYIQALSAIGRIEFKDGNAAIVFKDEAAGTEDLGVISGIKKISFGSVSEEDITKGDTPTAIVETEQRVSVSVYPNPVADHVHVDGIAESQVIRLFSSDGRLMFVGQQSDIDMSGMANGIYLLQVGKEVIKVVKK